MRYEILFLSVPEITLDETSALETSLRDIIREKQGNCLSFERWGKFKLAYPIKRHEYGVYFLIRFEGQSDQVKELLDALNSLLSLKYNEIVMRYILNRLKDGDTLQYQRPESLEEVPGKVSDSLMREHRGDMSSDSPSYRNKESRFDESDIASQGE